MSILARRRVVTLLTLAVVGGGVGAGAPAAAAPAGRGLDAKLDEAFRSQLDDVRVRLDYSPSARELRGRARLELTVRPGQRRVLFHFNPSRAHGPRDERGFLRRVRLDGRPVAPDRLRLVRGLRGAETAYEVPRTVRSGSRHSLTVTWRSPGPTRSRAWLLPRFDDTEGPRNETETMWPTVSSPEVLARHRITLRVHSPVPYAVIGSGSVSRESRGRGPQTWRLDTRARVSSSNVFFAAVPRGQVRSRTLSVRGVDVRILSDRSPATIRRAAQVTRRSLRDLVDELGPVPVPKVAVLLTGWGSGMEYYGATRTGTGALRHELGHLYFGTTTVNQTWRDTWFDEAAVVWWEERRRLRPVPQGFGSSLAVGRSVAAPGFDLRAYGAGARVLERIGRALGGDRAMLDFLAGLHERRQFAPFTTGDLIDDVLAAQDRIGRADLDRWLRFRRPR